MDKRFLEILTIKPQLITDFPSWMLPEPVVGELRSIDNVAIAEIAGRDSIAAAIEAVRTRRFEAVLPTIAYTGTEFGEWGYPFEKADFLKARLDDEGVRVFQPVVLGAPEFWWKLNGRYATHLSKTYGFYTPCVGCHLYFHAIRIPIAKRIGCRCIIGGERESHDGRTKINQVDVVLDEYARFMSAFDIELLLPLRYIQSGERIEQIIGQSWEEGGEQLKCVMNKNYLDQHGHVDYSEENMKRFLSEFALKVAEEEVQKLLK